MESNDWNDAERRVERAAELFEQRKLDEALQELRAAVTVNPYNAGWLYNLGLTLEELGRFDEAVSAYQQSLELEPEDVASLHRLGASLERLGRYRDAIAAFDRVESLDHEYEAAYCHRIACYTELKDHEKAEEVFYLGRLVQEHCPACYYHMGVSLAERHLWERAIFCWHRALESEPTHPMAHARLAQAYRRKGELDRARRHLLARLRQTPRDGAVILELCELLLSMDRTDEAGGRVAAAASLMPASPHVHFARAIWLSAAGRLADAAFAFEKTLQLDPTFPRAHLRLARASLALGRTIEAKTHLRSELLLRPSDPTTLKELSNLLIDTGELRSAITCLRRLVAVAPREITAHQNLAVAHFLRHQHAEGITASRKALEIDPSSLPIIHNLAMALGELGRHDEAIRLIQTSTVAADLEDLLLRLRLKRFRAKVGRLCRRLLRLRGD